MFLRISGEAVNPGEATPVKTLWKLRVLIDARSAKTVAEIRFLPRFATPVSRQRGTRFKYNVQWWHHRPKYFVSGPIR
jgi:hypothetical protein